VWANRTQLAGRPRVGQAISASNSRGSRTRTSSISATSRSRVPSTARIRPDCLGLHPHPLGDPADKLIGVKRLTGRRASTDRQLQLIGQPGAQPHEFVVAHPLGQRDHRRHDHLLGRGPVQGTGDLHLLQQLGVVHRSQHLRLVSHTRD
jgi:hypothetical protein